MIALTLRNANVMSWDRSPAKIVMSHMNAASPRQSLVKGERLIRYELASAMERYGSAYGQDRVLRAKTSGRVRKALASSVQKALYHVFPWIAFTICSET